MVKTSAAVWDREVIMGTEVMCDEAAREGMGFLIPLDTKPSLGWVLCISFM
jgi:aromatic ring hydroxylase